MYKVFEKLCEKKGVTVYRVSQETGIPTSTLSEWKKGLYTPKIDKMMKLAEYFEVPLETFVKE